MTTSIPFTTLLWRRLPLFLAGLAAIVQVYTGFFVSIPFYVIATLVQDWELAEKEPK